MPAAAGALDVEGGTPVNDRHGRSGAATFVTVLGWVLIGVAGLAVLAVLLQTAVFTVLLAMPDPPAPPEGRVPPHLALPLRMLLGLLVGFSVLVFASAIAFLKRRGWARRTFVTLFALAIVVNVAALLLLVVSSGRPSPLELGTGDRFAPLVRMMAIPTGAAAVVLSLLFAWLIKRLTSPAVRAEFDDSQVF
jgi:hypothetical protein